MAWLRERLQHSVFRLYFLVRVSVGFGAQQRRDSSVGRAFP